jgi:succinyl-CoA synthetase beta subunit
VDALALVEDYGIRVAPSATADTAECAVAAAERLGYPVVLKTACREVRHKVDVGGVHRDVDGADAVRASYHDLETRLGAAVLVQRQVPDGVELSLGVLRDPHVGPLVLVGAGGTLVELLGDRVVALPPVDHEISRRMLERLKVARLLAGHRDVAAADLEAVVAAGVAVSQLALELGDELEALDVNPLIVGPWGATAVDALVVPKSLEG